MSPMLSAVTAFLIDTLIGDPRSKFHPVVLIGNLISFTEKIFRRNDDGDTTKILKGGILVATVLLVTYFVGFGIVYLAALTKSFAVKIFVEALTLSFMISPKSLAGAGREIYNLLVAENIFAARRQVGYIVGRDTNYLNEGEIVRATVETVSENTTDGIISPLFYFAVGGLPLAVAYRAVNTMDSMLGYKNEKYFYFGRVAARLDDVANFIPARITAILFVVAAFVLNFDYKNCLAMIKRDADKHPSPNGGYAEAAVAGALRIRLGGINSYFGVPHFRAYMGDPIEILNPEHILSAVKMMYTATIIFLIALIIF